MDSAALRLDPVLMRAMEVRSFEDVEVVRVVAVSAKNDVVSIDGASRPSSRSR